MTNALERLVGLVKRELGTEDVVVLNEGEELQHDDRTLVAPLADGRHMVVRLGASVDTTTSTMRRLEMLVDSFADAMAPGRPRSSRPAPLTLHEVLSALSLRARAVEVFIIDGHSPVVWGSSAEGEPPSFGLVPQATVSPLRPDLALPRTEGDVGEPPPRLARAALHAVRANPSLALLHKGGHLHVAHLDATLGYIAHSFAGIYVIVLVFGAAYDELRAERALADALPVIERLVLALPPLDPEPEPRARAVRKPR